MRTNLELCKQNIDNNELQFFFIHFLVHPIELGLQRRGSTRTSRGSFQDLQTSLVGPLCWLLVGFCSKFAQMFVICSKHLQRSCRHHSERIRQSLPALHGHHMHLYNPYGSTHGSLRLETDGKYQASLLEIARSRY